MRSFSDEGLPVRRRQTLGNAKGFPLRESRKPIVNTGHCAGFHFGVLLLHHFVDILFFLVIHLAL